MSSYSSTNENLTMVWYCSKDKTNVQCSNNYIRIFVIVVAIIFLQKKKKVFLSITELKNTLQIYFRK